MVGCRGGTARSLIAKAFFYVLSYRTLISCWIPELSKMHHVSSLKGLVCGKEYGIDEIEYVCPDHGNEGLLEVRYDYIRRHFSRDDLLHSIDRSIWCYKPLLPIKPDSAVPPPDALELLGISGASNLATAIKFARYYELGEKDIVMTVLTDSKDS